MCQRTWKGKKKNNIYHLSRDPERYSSIKIFKTYSMLNFLKVFERFSIAKRQRNRFSRQFHLISNTSFENRILIAKKKKEKYNA